jgi:uncharacterized cupin superfamily protein
MAGYTKVNLKDEVEDQAPNFGLEGKIEARMARVPLGLEQQGVSYQRIAPNFRVPFGHRHKTQEEVYIVLSGSLRAKVEDETVELTAVRRAARAQGHDAQLRGRARRGRADRGRRAAHRTGRRRGRERLVERLS